jgi:hypothetical protein
MSQSGCWAAALCARLSDLRRQARLLAKPITSVEQELDVIVDEAGDTRSTRRQARCGAWWAAMVAASCWRSRSSA